MKLAILLALVALLSLTTALQAQVPSLVPYQGRVAIIGSDSTLTNFNRAGAFKFALVNDTGSTTYWSNDGTSSAGSEPTQAVLLSVEDGLFSVILGDTSFTNMSALPASVWTNSDVRLRVWFNDNSHGFQRLVPDQRLAPASYIADGAISSAKIATGAVGSSQLASNLTITGTFGASIVSGNGTGLTSLNASNVSSGTLTDARLSGNIPRLDGSNSFTGTLALNDLDLRLRSVGDAAQGLGYYGLAGGGKSFAAASVDGPVLYGYGGGGLGTARDGQQRLALYWNSAGKVGIGTSTPASTLQVGGGVRARGGSPGAAGVNDNGYAFSGNNGDSDSGMFSSGDGQLEFHTNAAERLRITSAGNVGVGVSAPDTPVSIARNSANPNFGYCISLNEGNTSLWKIGVNKDFGDFCIGQSGVSDNNLVVNSGGNVGIGYVGYGNKRLAVNGDLRVEGDAFKPGGGSWTSTSDVRVKKNIRTLAGALEKLLALRGVSFEYIDPAAIHELSGERMGLIAQEVEAVFPDWVETGSDGYKRVTVRGLEALVVEAVRELHEEEQMRSATREREIQALRKSVADLQREVRKLRK